MSAMRPDEAAALYVWAVGDGGRKPPDDPEEMRRVGRALLVLTEIAGDKLAYETVDLGDGTWSAIVVKVVRRVPS